MKKKRRLFRDRLKEDMRTAEFAEAYRASELPVRLAVRIAQLREAGGLTQKDLAHRMKTRQQVVSRLERGEDINPCLETLERAARALGKHLEIVFQ
jgi:ribosome-binding protein aMBF1 (putative translation factor)